MTKEEFLKNQPLISSSYLNAVKKNHLPHALLIYGDNIVNFSMKIELAILILSMAEIKT